MASVGEIDDILGRTRTRDKSENMELNRCEYCRCMEMNVNKQIIQPYEFSHSLEFFLLYGRDAFVKCSCNGNKHITNKIEIKEGTELYKKILSQMSILTKYILLTGNPTELSLAFMTYVCFSTETVNIKMFKLQGYKFELKGEHVYVLVKVFLDTGADILLSSQMFSKCLFMQSQPNISVSGNEIEHIRSCKVVIP